MREGIDAKRFHCLDLRSRVIAAVEVRRQDSAESPTSIEVLLGRSEHPLGTHHCDDVATVDIPVRGWQSPRSQSSPGVARRG